MNLVPKILRSIIFSITYLFIQQVLVTNSDLKNDETRQNLFSTLSELISLNIVPIINTNDAVTPPPPQEDDRPPRAKKVHILFFIIYQLPMFLLHE